MKCAVTHLFPRQIPYAHLALGTAFLAVPYSIGNIIARLLTSQNIKSEVKARGGQIVDLTETGQQIMKELKEQLDLDKEIFIAEYRCGEENKEIKKIIANGKPNSPACVCMDGREIDKTFNPQCADHIPHKLKLLLQLVQIKQRRQFGKPEQIYCFIAVASVAASSFSNLRLSWLWGLGAGQWVGNYWASRFNKLRWERAQHLACQKITDSELSRCIDLDPKDLCGADLPDRSLLLIPFDHWENRGFSQWHLKRLIERAEQAQSEKTSSDEETSLDFNADANSDLASSTSSLASQFSFEEITSTEI